MNDHEFNQIQVDVGRIRARGKKWKRFELLYSFIGAAWIEKWRRFGLKLLGAAFLLIGSPILLPIIFPAIFMYGTGGTL